MRYEYQEVVINLDGVGGYTPVLNRWGAEGWRVVHVWGTGESWKRVLMERQLPPRRKKVEF